MASEVSCPKCDEKFRVNIVGAIGSKQRINFRIVPKDAGGLVQAKVVGGTVAAFDSLMRACCKEDGARVGTYLERAETLADGSHVFHFVTLPLEAIPPTPFSRGEG